MLEKGRPFLKSAGFFFGENKEDWDR